MGGVAKIDHAVSVSYRPCIWLWYALEVVNS